MIVDALEIATDPDLFCDVCIAGGGAAGITIARELIGSGLGVILLEGGGLEYAPESQALYEGDLVGRDYTPLDVGRLRFFGGSTNHWEGSCAPLDPIDFEKRPWVEHSGWPITRAELDPYYERAQAYCGLGAFRYDPTFWRNSREGAPLPLDGARVTSRIAQGSPPTRFGEEYRSDLTAARNVRVVLSANITQLTPSVDGGYIERAEVSTLRGVSFAVRARYFVICLGGIENARLLLASDSVRPAGLGNEHDLVGRFFMDHPIVEGAQLLLSDPETDLRFYRATPIGNYHVNSYLQIADQAVRERQLTNVRLPFAPRTRYEVSEGIESYHRLKDSLGRAEWPPKLFAHLGNIIGDIDLVAEAVVRKLTGRQVVGSGESLALYAFVTMTEQVPTPSTRVQLSRNVDALGVRKVALDWRITPFDQENLWRAYEVVADAFGAAGLGRVRLLRDHMDVIWGKQLSWGHHHIGTTRMSDSPRTGVTDANCRVHSLANLFIGGSSVFPTGGHVPPTLTIVALANRLADHLKRVAAH